MQNLQLSVEPDFLAKQTRTRPIQAVAELIWNALDADATSVTVEVEKSDFGTQRIFIADNGHGIPFADVESLFARLGGSWKKPGGRSKTKNRYLHGSEGRGRFKAFSLAQVVDWESTYDDNGQTKQFTISVLAQDLRQVRVSDERPAKSQQTGVRVILSELISAWTFLDSTTSVHALAETFAIYLKAYPETTVVLPGGTVDPQAAINQIRTFNLQDVEYEGKPYSVTLDVIEWKQDTERILYLCNGSGFPLEQLQARIQAPGFHFSAYVKSDLMSTLSGQGTLGLGELNPDLVKPIEEARSVMRTHFRERAAESARSLVQAWKEEDVYPYTDEPKNPIDVAERQVFDIVALKLNRVLPDFAEAAAVTKKFQLTMLRQAIEKSPEDLQRILHEVLGLPENERKALARLLDDASLSAIISAAKVVTDRLKFVEALEFILFDTEQKQKTKERAQLHRFLADNTWLFGEEFNLTVDDQSLTNVLKKHLKLLKSSTIVDEPVKRVDGTTGIIDLMLSRSVPSQRADELEHLVIELKAPKVRVGANEINQIEGYAFAVAQDERFANLSTKWTFWVVSNEMDAFAQNKAKQANQPRGMVHQSEDRRISIWAKTWSQILQENKSRLRFLKEKLEFSTDSGRSFKYLQETYTAILAGTEVVEEGVVKERSAGVDSAITMASE